jgi:PTS system fructose-specific IIC component
MNLARYITVDAVKLEMTSRIEPPLEDEPIDRWRQQAKEQVIEELVELLDSSYRIGNRSKLLIDFINREKKATTAIGHGVAVPHIRSMQAKDFMLAFARSAEGYEFDAPDGKPVHLFFVMAAPPYDDSLYLKAFKSLAEMLRYEQFREELLNMESPGEIVRVMRSME